MIVSRINVTVLSNESILYHLQQTGTTGVLIRLTSNNFTENFTTPQLLSDDIPNNVLLQNNETKLFIPGCELQYTYMLLHFYILNS